MALTRGRIHRERRAHIGLARGVAHLERLVVHADVVGRNVEQLRVRRVGRRLLVLGAERGRADALHVDVLARLVGRSCVEHLRTAVGRRVLVHVDAGGPVHLRIVLLGNEQLAGGAVHGVGETVAVEMGQQLARLAVDRLIREDHLVDAVIVPLVVGRHLIDPLGDAGIRVARPDRHRPFVVAGTLLRIPGRGIARSVIDEVQFWVVGDPAPGSAAADLPLITLPGLEAGVLADRLAERGGLLGVDQKLVVRPFRISAPGQLARLDVVGRHMRLDAELAAGDADQHLVLDDHGRRRAGLALAGIAILGGPCNLTGLGIERDQGRVGLMQEDLAIAVGEATVDRVAAHHRDDVRILLRLVLPDDLVLLRKVNGIDLVRERRVDVHDVADDQRAAFMAAQHAGREGPGNLELAHVLRVDLVELGIAGIGIVAGRHNPVFRVLRHLDQLVIG